MPMIYSTAGELAVLLHDEPLAQVTELKPIRADIYRIRFSDRRDGPTHTILEPGQVVAWIDSVLSGRVLQPDYGIWRDMRLTPRRARPHWRAAPRLPPLSRGATRGRPRG